MSIPLFKLTRKVSVQCYRKTPGEYVDGDYVEGFEVPFTIEANVQPLKVQEQLMLKEAERERDWINIYTSNDLQGMEAGDDGRRGDIVEWEGYRWQVMKSKKYQMGILDHTKAQAARLETTVTKSYPESD